MLKSFKGSYYCFNMFNRLDDGTMSASNNFTLWRSGWSEVSSRPGCRFASVVVLPLENRQHETGATNVKLCCSLACWQPSGFSPYCHALLVQCDGSSSADWWGGLRGFRLHIARASDCHWLHEMMEKLHDARDCEWHRTSSHNKQFNGEHWPSTCWLWLSLLPSKLHY